MYNDELQHFGVKGMKWGRRKARPNSDKSVGKRISKSLSGLDTGHIFGKAKEIERPKEPRLVNGKKIDPSLPYQKSKKWTTRSQVYERVDDNGKVIGYADGERFSNTETALTMGSLLVGAAAVHYGAYKGSKWMAKQGGKMAGNIGKAAIKAGKRYVNGRR